MLAIIWVTLFVCACASCYYTLTDRLPIVIGGVCSIALFGVLAFGALNIVVIDGGSVAFRSANQVLSFLAIAGVVVNLLYLFADATGQLSGDERPIRGDRS